MTKLDKGILSQESLEAAPFDEFLPFLFPACRGEAWLVVTSSLSGIQ